MRKIQLTEIIQSYLTGGNAPADIRGKFHGAEIDELVASAYNDLIFSVFLESKKYSEYSQLDAFAKPFRAIAVAEDTDRSLFYSVMPFPPVQLPDNQGIRMICPNDDNTYAFAFMDNNSMAVFSELEVDSVDDTTAFWVEKATGNEYRVYYDKPADSLSLVMMKLILPLGEYDDFDDVPMPAGKELVVRDAVVDRLRDKPREELIDDNVPNT